MASDLRWTGGPANRAWCSGTRVGRVIDPDRITADVAAYLADVRRHRAILSQKHHPTVDSCLKAVYHAGPAEAQAIGAEYARQVASG